MKIDISPREPRRRRQDVLRRLDQEIDVWVASADADGLPCLVPLWFVWHEEAVWLATRTTNPTGRNLSASRRARLALGDTQDVVLLDGDVETYALPDVPAAAAEAFLARTGWDPRRDSPSYAFFRVRPRAVRAWHGQHELAGRHLMKDGTWLT